MAHTKAALIAKVTSFRRRQKREKNSSIRQVVQRNVTLTFYRVQNQ
jgi:hypothetical protein